MSERTTTWGRARRSKALFAVALTIALITPVYLYLVFPYIWMSQVDLMQRAHLHSEAELVRGLLKQVALNLFAWLLPIGLAVLALIFLGMRTFLKSDTI